MMKSASDLFNQWTKDLTPQEALINVVNKIRDIPFQFIGSRDIDSMLAAGVGTCNAKHMLLKQFAEQLGFQVRFVIDKFHLSDFIKNLDQKDPAIIELQKITSQLSPYYHTYLQIQINNQWIPIDITFDSALKPFGFTVAPNWDGQSPTPLPHQPLETFTETDRPDLRKSELLANENSASKELRKTFFAKLNAYLQKIRKAS